MPDPAGLNRPIRAPGDRGALIPAPIVILVAAFVCLLWNLTLQRIEEDRQRYRAELATQTATLAAVYRQSISDTINEVDRALRLIRQLRQNTDRALPWSSILRVDYALNSAILHIVAIDALGNPIASTNPEIRLRRDNFHDRDFFAVHVGTNSDDLFISKTVFSRTTGMSTIHLTRSLLDSEGNFAGVLLASLDPDQLSHPYDTVDLGNAGGVALLGADDIFRAGTGTFKQRVGSTYREPATLREYYPLQFPKSVPKVAVEHQLVDGIGRLVVSQPVANYPLQVMVAMTDRTPAGIWNETSRPQIMLAVVFTLLSIVVIIHVVRSNRTLFFALRQRNTLEVEKKVAEAAAHDRSMFLAIMSHEIRTPLNGVLGALDLIRDGNLDARSRQCVSMATESGELLLALIDDVLLFSKSDNATINLNLVPTSLKTLLSSVKNTMDPMASKAGNQIAITIDENTGRQILVDEVHLRQILTNLVSNSIKFTSRGQIQLSARTRALEANQMIVRIAVTDTGIGIPAHKQQIIFDRFQTLDPSYTRRSDGTGLGLAICDKLVRAMGSTINVESDVGVGSTFWFDLVVQIAPAAAASADDTSVRDDIPRGKRSLRILLAEDNPTNTYVATEVLTDAGHCVRHAPNGRIAVEFAAAERFDVILMDMSMPEMDGITATALIRTSGSINAATPIIALTAHLAAHDKDKLQSAQLDGYLTKPVRKKLLLNAVTSGRTSCIGTATNAPKVTRLAPIIDMGILLDFLAERRLDRSVKTINIFITELRKKSDALTEITSARDMDALQQLAHSVLGSGQMLGAGRLTELARIIEHKCLQDEFSDWTLATEFTEVIRVTVRHYYRFDNEEALRVLRCSMQKVA